jgi:hypothetical protein
MMKCGVLFEVRTEFLNSIETSFGLKGLNLNSVNQLIFVMVKCSVLFDVRTEFLNSIETSFGFKVLTKALTLRRPTWSCTGSGSWSPTSHRGGPGSRTSQSTWGLWWTKWHWDRFFHEFFCSSVDIIPPWLSTHMYHLEDEQQGRWWPQFRDTVSPYRHKQEANSLHRTDGGVHVSVAVVVLQLIPAV